MSRPVKPDAIMMPAPAWSLLIVNQGVPVVVVGPWPNVEFPTAWARANVRSGEWFVVPLYTCEEFDETGGNFLTRDTRAQHKAIDE